MPKINSSSRARGSNRGGVGGGYERTDPDWDSTRIKRLREEYNSLDVRWRKTYLKGLSKSDRIAVLNINEL
jgi:hypothetical protein